MAQSSDQAKPCSSSQCNIIVPVRVVKQVIELVCKLVETAIRNDVIWCRDQVVDSQLEFDGVWWNENVFVRNSIPWWHNSSDQSCFTVWWKLACYRIDYTKENSSCVRRKEISCTESSIHFSKLILVASFVGGLQLVTLASRMCHVDFHFGG